MTRRKKGILGEAQVLLELVKNDYEIFLPYSDGTPFDLVAYKEGLLYRVSIKFTSSLRGNSWLVTLKNVSRRNDGECCVKHFDKTECDLLAVYIQPENRVVFLNSCDINSISQISIKKMEG